MGSGAWSSSSKKQLMDLQAGIARVAGQYPAAAWYWPRPVPCSFRRTDCEREQMVYNTLRIEPGVGQGAALPVPRIPAIHEEQPMSPAALRVVEGSSMDKSKALDAALSQIERHFGKGSIMR